MTDSFTVPFSAAPALIYLHTDHDTATLVDRTAVTSDPRERAICRALLTTALDLLDATEPTRMTAIGVRP